MPPARTHFWLEVARGYGAGSSPVKYGLNGIMPATVNRTVLSCGIRLALGTSVWPRATKKSRKAARSSSAVMEFIGTARLPAEAPMPRPLNQLRELPARGWRSSASRSRMALRPSLTAAFTSREIPVTVSVTLPPRPSGV